MARTSMNPFLPTSIDSKDRRKTQGAPKKEIWSSLLKSVSSGKRLPEKQLLLLGGSPDTQKEFLESLSTDSAVGRRHQFKKPPIANRYALGFTYQDVLDADHEDILARLSIYTIADASPSFAPLLKPLLNPKTIASTLIVILLDWSQPREWVRQLRNWIRLLRSIVVSLDDESKQTMEENLDFLRNRKRSNTVDGTSSSKDDPSLPLGPGEWDEPLGVPLCVVCQNTDKMQQLEKENGWKDEQFDFVGQFIRTILLKHGGSLIYTMPSAPGSLQTLIHASLGIQSMLQKKELKHEVSNRDKTLVPPNWDSWGKIRLMADNFDVETISEMWSHEIQSLEQPGSGEDVQPNGTSQEASAVNLYEHEIRDAKNNGILPGVARGPQNGIEIESKDVQTFLAEQAKILEELHEEDRKEKAAKDMKKSTVSQLVGYDDRRDVEEHIGPVQFNMGGIQVDADDMLKKLKDREATRSSEDGPKSPLTPKESAEVENAKLSEFFAKLARKPGGSATNTPRRGDI